MEWFLKNKNWIIGAGFLVLSTLLRFLSGDQTEHPTGWDGYYYVMQVHSWMSSGHMQSPDFSLIYPYLTIMTFVTGDPVTGFKIGTALIAGLLTLSVYYYLLDRKVALTVICVACGYIAFSPLITYFILQFPKNAFGLAFFIFFMSSLKRPGIFTAILFLCTILTHRMTGAFALIVVGSLAVRHISWKWIVAGVVLVIAVGFLPGIIHISDLSRLDGQLVPMPHWAPLAFTKIFPTSLDWLFKADLVLITIMTITCVVLVATNYPQFQPGAWTWLLIVLISLFPFFSFKPGDIGHRFLMIAPIAVIVLISLTVKPFRIPSLVVAGLFVVLSFFSWRSYVPRAFDAPNNSYVMIVDRLVDRYDATEYPLVIAHKGLAEIIIYKTGFDALNWLPPEGMPTDSVLRICRNVINADFERYLDKEDRRRVRAIAATYYVLPEATWQKFVDAAKKENKRAVMRRIFSGSNPMDPRPYFISKGKKH
jgi:hypothetical protein